jgi:hypothetical protein
MMRSALFCLSPSIASKSIVNWSLFPVENFSNKVMPSLQLGHQVAQNTNKTGFPLKSLRETVFPSNPFREKAGASFFSGKRWTPKEEQEGQSSRKAGGAPTACKIEMNKTTTPNIKHKREKRVFLFIIIPESMPDKDRKK